jgi:transcriptional regulator with XRE-family HTH domain
MDKNPAQEAVEIIGKQIRTLRNYRGYSAFELAEIAGIRTATLIDLENGKTNFEISTLMKISSALNCALEITFTPIDSGT